MMETDSDAVTILDIGCGVGHGTYMLREIKGARILAIDVDKDALAFAKKHYHHPAIEYAFADYAQFEPGEFDYVVSRHALEHIENGLEKTLRLPARKRIIINVPYKEKAGNEHHYYLDITENDFQTPHRTEFFYEDLAGVTYSTKDQQHNINSIVCVASQPEMHAAAECVSTPFSSWQPNYIEALAYDIPPLKERLSVAERDLADSHNKISMVQSELAATQAELAIAQNVLRDPVIRAYRKLRRLWGKPGW